MRFSELIDRLVLRAPSLERAGAARLVEGVITELAARVPRSLARELFGLLPEPHARTDTSEVQELFESLARRLAIPLPLALEQGQVALQMLAGVLSPELRARLERELPENVALLLKPRDLHQPSPRTHHDPHAHDLASGHPGSDRSLSTASWPERALATAHPDRAQRESLARTDNPHGDVKLASSHGSTQEREHETLAEGRPKR